MSKANPSSPTGSRLPIWKKASFAVAATILFFVAVEGILMAVGVRPLLYDDDPHVGFASNIPLFVEDSGGKMITASNKVRWFNQQQFSRRKPSGVTRVFCVGGSTTYGRPYTDSTSFCGWLREYLPAADPSRKWEVINAGGISYASYRVAKLMEELADYEPDLFIVYSGHNEFLEERTYSGIIETPAAVRGLQSSLGKTLTYSFMAGLLGRRESTPSDAPVLAEEVNTILDQSAGLKRYKRDPALERKIIEHYRYNISRMIDIAQSASAQSIFVTPAANLRNSSPFKSEHDKGLSETQLNEWRTIQKSAQSLVEASGYANALEVVDLALSIDESHAHSHYLRAQILQVLGKIPEANESYIAALENDVCPLRILPEMRDVLAEVVSGRGAPLVDYHTFLKKRAEHGIPGDDWFLDHVHPTIEGHRLLALELIAVMEREGILSDKNAMADGDIQQIKSRVLASLDDEARGIALRNLGNVLNWAGKKEEAYEAAKKSLALAPGDAYAHYLVGDLAGKLGKTREAEKHLRELTRFQLNSTDAPYFPDAHYQLAQILGKRGEMGESVKLLAKTLKLKPDHAGAAEALPRVLEAHGKANLQAGRFAEAATAFADLEKRYPSHAMAANLLGVALIQEKKFPEAIKVPTRAASKQKGNATVHNNLGSAYARSSQPAEAAHHFQLAVQYNPQHAGAHLNLARLLEKSGKSNQAADQYREVLKLDPKSKEALAAMNRLSSSQQPQLDL